MADNIFGDGNVGYAGDLMTMRGPTGQRQRRRLQVGMRLADGTIYTGESQIAGLEARAAELKEKIAQFEQELVTTIEKIRELKGPVQDVAILTQAAQEFTKVESLGEAKTAQFEVEPTKEE